MAATTKKSILSSLYGNANDVATTIAQDTSLPAAGFQDPPPGIRNGRAQLEEVKFDVYKSGENEGKPYFTATGIILEPINHRYTPTSQGKAADGTEPIEVRVAGQQTRIRIDIFDKKTKTGKNMGKVTPWQDGAKEAAQHMRALGADTSKVRQVSDLEGIAENLTRVARDPQTPIYFSFETSVRKAQNQGDADGTWQNWHGTAGLENYTPPDESMLATNDGGGAEGAAFVDDSNPQAALAYVQSDDDTTPSGSGLEDADIDTLLAAAQAKDTDAQDELLRRVAEATGKTMDEVNEAVSSWEEVIALINGDASPQEAAPAEPEPPKKGDHVGYKPMVKGIKGLAPAKKAVECVVETVNVAKKTVTLKNTVDGKTKYADVAWATLEDPT
jgi:hypothetical protein